MAKIFKNHVVNVFSIILLCASSTVSSDALFGDDNDKDMIWQSGLNFYFKYVPQDETDYGVNDHPINLVEKEISTALEALKIEEKSLLTADEIRTVFTIQQLKLLGVNLAKGLRNAKPEQDIIFVMQKASRKLGFLNDRSYLAGRAFFKDGKLNLIIGDYELPANDAFESVYDPSGKRNIPYAFSFGYRSNSAAKFRKDVIKNDGVINMIAGGELRQDWFIIDIKVAAAAVLAEQNNAGRSSGSVDTEAMRQESERLARERRQLRLEMARMRKEMQESGGTVKSEELTIEERLARLDELHAQKLISDDEYEQKRKEILDDI